MSVPKDFPAQENFDCDDHDSFDEKDLYSCGNSGSSISEPVSFDNSATRNSYGDFNESFDMEGLTISDSTAGANSGSIISIENGISLDESTIRNSNVDDNDSFDMEDLTVSNSLIVTNTNNHTIENNVSFDESANRADNGNR